MQKTRRFTKDKMFALIRKWENSGLTQENFFNQLGIPKSTYSYWRTIYLEETERGTSKNSFIPVKVDNTLAGYNRVLEVVYPNGVRLVCPADTDLSLIKSLIVL
jgi:hypothetical protein